MKFIKALGMTTLLSLSTASWADIAVIVNLKNNNTYTGIDADLIERIYLGKASQFPDGTPAVPYDLAKGDSVREQFGHKILNKNPSQLHAYWSRSIFSGKKQPPREVSSAEAMKAAVAADLNAIGYINAYAVDATVAVLYTIKD